MAGSVFVNAYQYGIAGEVDVDCMRKEDVILMNEPHSEARREKLLQNAWDAIKRREGDIARFESDNVVPSTASGYLPPLSELLSYNDIKNSIHAHPLKVIFNDGSSVSLKAPTFEDYPGIVDIAPPRRSIPRP